MLKNVIKESKSLNNSKGYTLMELLAVLIILGIVSLIAVPSVLASIEKAKEEMCEVNRVEISRVYQLRLMSNEMAHNEKVFKTHLLEMNSSPCPEDGIFMYKDGMILCDIHVNENDHQNEEDVEVPFL